jgi:hypothetical protein
MTRDHAKLGESKGSDDGAGDGNTGSVPVHSRLR